MRITLTSFLLLLSFSFISCKSLGPSENKAPILASGLRQDLSTAHASGNLDAIATQGKAATQAAKLILDQGGNLIDAFVAASFVISVERPHSTGIGGGGFLIFHEAKTGLVHAVDFRERAPAKATETMFLDAKGEPSSQLSQDSILAVAVPGLVAGLVEVHNRFGRKPWSELLQPAIRLAEEGFEVYPSLHKALTARQAILAQHQDSRRIFLDPKGNPWPVGHRLIQKDLGKTLRAIARAKRQGFHQGPVAAALVSEAKRQKGLLTAEDLTNYQVKWRIPVRARYQSYEVVSMPPPSSGGIHVIQFLKMLEPDRLSKKGHLSADSIHLAASALQSAFADRAKYLGDPDFVKVPAEALIAEEYLKKRRGEIEERRFRRAEAVSAGRLPVESTETTHLSLMDAEGNAIASTQTINGWMGSGIVAQGTGILLNNEMDDFSARPGASNLFGAIGSQANAVAPGKTPLSSMSPTLLLDKGKPVLAVGAPGGTRIISCVAQTILNVTEFGLPLKDAVASVRYHQQWKPDVLTLDPPGPGPEVIQELEKRGHKIKLEAVPCNVMAVSRQGDRLEAVSDPRDIGTATARSRSSP